MKTSDFDYDLPEELIAQHPLEKRDHSRLMCIDRFSGAVQHRYFYELPGLLARPSLLVVNNTRVFPARLLGSRSTGGQVELLLVRKLEEKENGELWRCLGKPRRKLRPGTELKFNEIDGLVCSADDESITVELSCPLGVMQGVTLHGHVPLSRYYRD